MKVFISHSAKDVDLARRLKDRLAEAGLDVFWAEDQVAPGENLPKRVGQALESADAMVVLVTPDAGKSPNLRAEVEFALGTPRFKDRLIPVFVGKSSVSSPDTPWILRQLRHVRANSTSDFSEVLDQLTERAV